MEGIQQPELYIKLGRNSQEIPPWALFFPSALWRSPLNTQEAVPRLALQLAGEDGGVSPRSCRHSNIKNGVSPWWKSGKWDQPMERQAVLHPRLGSHQVTRVNVFRPNKPLAKTHTFQDQIKGFYDLGGKLLKFSELWFSHQWNGENLCCWHRRVFCLWQLLLSLFNFCGGYYSWCYFLCQSCLSPSGPLMLIMKRLT